MSILSNVYIISDNEIDMDQNLSKLGAKFSVYGAYINAPEALTIWAEYAIYEAIDKIPQIWYAYGSMWSKMVLSGAIWRAVQLLI